MNRTSELKQSMEISSEALSRVYSIHRPVIDDISIVIPTLSRPILEQCLYWIVVGSAWPGKLIIVDQGSNSDILVWIEQLSALGIDVRRIASNQRGRAAGINCGLEQIATPFVAITDDDCFVDRYWLANMEACLRKYPEAVVTGRVEPAGEDTKIVVTSTVPAVYRKPRLKFDSMSGGNMGTSLSVFDRVGSFDEDPRLSTAEDAEWSYRALRRGVQIVYAPEITVRHLGWRDPSKRVEQYRSYAHSHGGFYGKYLRRGDWFIALRAFIHQLRATRKWLSGMAKGDKELALIGWSYMAGLFPGMVAGIRSRKTE